MTEAATNASTHVAGPQPPVVLRGIVTWLVVSAAAILAAPFTLIVSAVIAGLGSLAAWRWLPDRSRRWVVPAILVTVGLWLAFLVWLLRAFGSGSEGLG